MNDLIDRQELLSFLHKFFKDGFLEDRWWNSTHVLAAIDKLPSAQPKRKTGRWILIEKAPGFPDWICSECGGSGRGDYLFCPWCQAKMKSKQTLSEVDNDTAYGGLMSAT